MIFVLKKRDKKLTKCLQTQLNIIMQCIIARPHPPPVLIMTHHLPHVCTSCATFFCLMCQLAGAVTHVSVKQRPVHLLLCLHMNINNRPIQCLICHVHALLTQSITFINISNQGCTQPNTPSFLISLNYIIYFANFTLWGEVKLVKLKRCCMVTRASHLIKMA